MVTQFWVGPATQLGPPTIVQTIGVACAAYGRPKTAATANNLNNRRRISPPHRVLAPPRQARPGFSERASSEHRTQSGTPSQEAPCEVLQSTCLFWIGSSLQNSLRIRRVAGEAIKWGSGRAERVFR